LNIETNYLGFSERLVFLVGWNPIKCKEGILGADRIGVCRTKAKALISTGSESRKTLNCPYMNHISRGLKKKIVSPYKRIG
jgi:hypothetical protein